jgi:hypothetical protein
VVAAAAQPLAADHWLGLKLVLLVVYIALGTLALKRAPTLAAKASVLRRGAGRGGFHGQRGDGHHPLGVFAP